MVREFEKIGALIPGGAYSKLEWDYAIILLLRTYRLHTFGQSSTGSNGLAAFGGKNITYPSKADAYIRFYRSLLHNMQAYVPQAQVVCPVYANRSGKVSAFDVRSVGNAIVELGGGRRKVIDVIDYGVGLMRVKSIGESVSPDIPFAFAHAVTGDSADRSSAKLQAVIAIEESASMANPVILKRLRRQQVLQ